MRKEWMAILILISAVLTFGCSDDKKIDIDPTDKTVNEWIYETMAGWYLWEDELPASPDYSLSPDKFFSSLLSDKDGVIFNKKHLYFSTIEKKDSQTKTISESDSYGFEFASFATQDGKYYAWVLYVVPGSAADKAGLKRGDWIVAKNSTTPNITSIDDYKSGSATKLTLAKYMGNGVFQYLKEVEIGASQVLTFSPLLKDSVYSIDGRKIGYLLYDSFTKGPDNKDDSYNKEMEKIFQNFKSSNVNEFVLDLRYNGGGLVDCAQLLSSYLAPMDALGKTFCKLEYNSKHTSSNKTLSFLSISKLGNANLNLKRIAVLVGSTTASASEAVINCLSPYVGRSNIRIIGEKTIGKTVGSNTFGEKENYDWLIHPITLRIYNSDGKADYADGFTPDVELRELVAGNTLYPFGDTNEMLLKEALAWINGKSTKSHMATKAESSNLTFVGFSFESRRGQGLIVEE